MTDASVSDEGKPWGRQRNESAKAYAAFRAWRDRGPERTLAGTRSIDRRWSARWHWRQRAAAWDDECWRRLDQAHLAALDTPTPGRAANVVPIRKRPGAFHEIVEALSESKLIA